MGKKFKQGSIIAGIAAIIFGIIMEIWNINFLMEYKDPSMLDFFLNALGIIFIIVGIITLVRGIKDKSVKIHGKSATGKIVKGWVVTTTQTNNGCTSTYKTYYLKFEFTDGFGNLSTTETTVSKKIYYDMSVGLLVPIIVYKERAILDVKALRIRHMELIK